MSTLAAKPRRPKATRTDRDLASPPQALASSLQAWFARSRRDLPWRAAPRNAYHALVAELMLQQTQVSRVVEYFQRFIGRFPTVQALAAADEQDVMTLWSGLGYYRRARHLHAAAKMVIERFGG